MANLGGAPQNISEGSLMSSIHVCGLNEGLRKVYNPRPVENLLPMALWKGGQVKVMEGM